MAGELTGREIICALKKAAAWRTAVACGAGDGLLILSDGIKANQDTEPDDSAGQPWINEADPGMMNVAGNLEAYMRYEGFDTALALIMGIAGAPTQIDLTAAYSNSYKLASKIDGLFGTLATKKLISVTWEHPSVKLHGFKLSGEMNKPLKLGLDVIADRLNRSSVINTPATMDSITVPDTKNRILMNKDTVFRMNTQADGALGGVEQIYPSGFELTFNRPMDAEATAGQDGVDEPADNGFPVATLTLKFPRYNAANNSFFSDWEAFTSKKMDITFTGKEIESGNNYMFRIFLPHIKISNPEAAVSGAGKIPFSMQCDIFGADVAPVGMDGIVEPMQIDIVNTRITDPLV
jgi:tail tube protein